MIPPRKQWCIQIDVTNACPRRCANCTRLCAHAREPFTMDRATFETAARALAAFPTDSPPDPSGRRKLVGLIGGEPLLHPQFPELVTILRAAVPERSHRGLWTGLDFRQHRHRDSIDRLLGPRPTVDVAPQPRGAGGYLNQNLHHPNTPSRHQPVLVAIQDVVRDEAAMWRLIEQCPLQRAWSASITPKGFFFCEVAGALDTIFEGPGGLPITPGCWRHDLADYRQQIERWCPRCGICLPLVPRVDGEARDDVSASNLQALIRLKSPRVLRGEFVEFDASRWEPPENWEPLRYRGGP